MFDCIYVYVILVVIVLDSLLWSRHCLQKKHLPFVSQESYRILILHLQSFNIRRCSV
jgi:hypothetical protein